MPFVGPNSFGLRGSRANEFAPTILQGDMDNVKLWTQGVPVEEAAHRQIRNIASLPILGGHVAIMPDVHLGKGATVGAVIPTRGAIIPAAVGVDIGCGMVAVRTTLKASDLPDSLAAIRAQIERDVPVGFHSHKAPLQPREHALRARCSDASMAWYGATTRCASWIASASSITRASGASSARSAAAIISSSSASMKTMRSG